MIITSARFFKTGLSYDSADRLTSVPNSTTFSGTLTDSLLANTVWDSQAVDSYVLTSIPYKNLKGCDYAVINVVISQGSSVNSVTEKRCYYIVGLTEIRSDADDSVIQVHLLRDRFAESFSSANITDVHVTRRARFDGDNEPYSPIMDVKYYNLQSSTPLNEWSTVADTSSSSTVTNWVVENDVPMNWVIMVVTADTTVGTDKYSNYRTYTFPIPQSGSGAHIKISSSYKSCLPIQFILGGKLDEKLGLLPESILGLWVTDTQPATGTWEANVESTTGYGFTNDTANPWVVDTLGDYAVLRLSENMGMAHRGRIHCPIWEKEINLKSTTKEMIVVSDPMGNTIGSPATDREFKYIRKQLYIGTSSCYVIFSFSNISGQFIHDTKVTTYPYTDPSEYYADCTAGGNMFVATCETLDMTSNSWSTYNYTGQREYERTVAQNSVNQTYEQGIVDAKLNYQQGKANVINAGAQGGALGLLAANPAFSVASAGINVIGSWVSNELNYKHAKKSVKATKQINEKYTELNQQAMDSYMKSQPSTALLIGGGGTQWICQNSPCYRLNIVTPDERALAKQNNLEDRYGYTVDEFYLTLPSIKGYLQCSSCNVQGVTPEAKTEIKEILTAGVRLL